MLLLLLKSVEFDDDVALLLNVAGLVMGPHGTSESEIGSTDSAALRTSRACLRLRLYIMLYKMPQNTTPPTRQEHWPLWTLPPLQQSGF